MARARGRYTWVRQIQELAPRHLIPGHGARCADQPLMCKLD